MSEEKLSHLIARTILRVKYGLATDGEKRTLEQWLEGGEERRRIYDRILSGNKYAPEMAEKLPEHADIAYRTAAEGTVLLSNTLPQHTAS